MDIATLAVCYCPVVYSSLLADSAVAERIANAMKAELPSSEIFYRPIPLATKPPSVAEAVVQQNNDEDEQPQSQGTVLYIGGESLALTNLLITHASYEVSHLLSVCRISLINFCARSTHMTPKRVKRDLSPHAPISF